MNKIYRNVFLTSVTNFTNMQYSKRYSTTFKLTAEVFSFGPPCRNTRSRYVNTNL